MTIVCYQKTEAGKAKNMSYSLLNYLALARDKVVSKDLKIYCHHYIVLHFFEVEKYHARFADGEPWVGRCEAKEVRWQTSREREARASCLPASATALLYIA